jgi:hypothetical protein
VYAETSLPWLRKLDAVETLRRVWLQQYHASEFGTPWRADRELPPSALLITSPYDVEARYSRKKSTTWTGYKVHFTETCEANTPHLIVEITPTAATTPDGEIIGELHEQLAEQKMLPDQHLVDMGYVDAEILAESQSRNQVEIVGPVMPDLSWQTKEGVGFDHRQFSIDWQAHRVTCPLAQTSQSWGTIRDRHGKTVVRVRFPQAVCQACPFHEQCTQSPARVLILQPGRSGLSGASRGSCSGTDPGVSRGVYQTSRGRRDHCAGGAHVRNAPRPLHRQQKAAAPSLFHCRCHECPSGLRMDGRGHSCFNPSLTLCQAGCLCKICGGCLVYGNSPTIS